jgi:hypothetical protein
MEYFVATMKVILWHGLEIVPGNRNTMRIFFSEEEREVYAEDMTSCTFESVNNTRGV